MNRIMKHILKVSSVFMLLLLAISFPSIHIKANDLEATYHSIKTIKLDDITDVTSIIETGTCISSNVKEISQAGTYTYYYEFRISEPSYVNMKSYAKITSDHDSEAYFYLSTSKLFIEKKIMDVDLNEGTCDYTTALEAGTYYLKVKFMPKWDEDVCSSKLFNFGIYAEPVVRTGTKIGTTMKKAIETGNKTSYGFFSSTSKSQFFKFSVNTKSDVTLTTIYNQPL